MQMIPNDNGYSGSAGKLSILTGLRAHQPRTAVTSPVRAPMAPDVPSVAELGQKKLIAENFLGVSGPAGLPKNVVDRLHAAMKKALSDAKVRERLAELGVQGHDMSPQEFTAFVANQVKEWYQPVKDSGAKLN